jgi:hypothetical protein
LAARAWPWPIKGEALNYRKLSIAAVAATAVLLGLVQSGTARGHITECNKTYSHTTLHGTVVVKRGDVCSLHHVRVTGSLTIRGGKFGVQHSSIRGQWLITGGTGTGSGDQCGNNVGGGLRVKNAHGGRFIFGEIHHHANCAGGHVSHGVRFVNDTDVGIVELDGYVVYGGVVDTGNSGGYNEIEGNTVHGSATCANNNMVHGGATAQNDDGVPNTYRGKNTGCPA